MSDHILVLSTEMSREELRAMGLRVFGDTQFGGHLVSRNSLYEKITASGRRVLTTNWITPPGSTEGVRVATIVYRDGTPCHAGTDPNSIRTVEWGRVEGDTVESSYRTALCKLIREILTPVINRNVTICVPHNTTAELNEDESRFVIHIWASPEQDYDYDSDESFDPPSVLWGTELPITHSMDNKLWSEGTEICAPESTKPIAAFDTGNLFVYADLCHRSSKSELTIFEQILKAVAIQYKATKVVVTSEEARDDYVKMVCKRKEAKEKEYRDSLTETQRELKESNTRIVELIRDERRILKDMSILESDDDFNKDRFIAEYDRLMSNPLIKRIKMSTRGITAYTNVLNVTDPRTGIEHELGEMSIYIDVQRYNVVTKNLTRQVVGLNSGMHGPHVFPDGRMCLGNMEEVIPKLIATYQLADTIEMLLAILQTVNVDDPAGRKVNCWPKSVKQIEKEKAAKPVKKDTVSTDIRVTVGAIGDALRSTTIPVEVF